VHSIGIVDILRRTEARTIQEGPTYETEARKHTHTRTQASSRFAVTSRNAVHVVKVEYPHFDTPAGMGS
jgi:hypothetical protein